MVPDIACYSKGLTGGSLPLAVTMCAARIFEAHFSDDRRKTFFHSSSYTANPIACAAALENLRIWRDEPVMDRIGRITAEHRRRLSRLAAIDGVSNTRQIGTIAAFEIDQPGTDYFSGLGPIMQRYFFARGVLLRPLGNTVYMMPPYCVTDAELGLLYDAVAELVAELRRHPERIMD